MKKILLVSCLLGISGFVSAAPASHSDSEQIKVNKGLESITFGEQRNFCQYEENTYQEGAIKQIGDRYIYCVDLNKGKSHWSSEQKMGWADEDTYKKEYKR